MQSNQNDEIIMKANIKKDKIKDANKNKEDYLRYKFIATKNYKSSIKINENIEYLESIVKEKKESFKYKRFKERDMIKNSIEFLQARIKELDNELFLIKRRFIIEKNWI